MKLLLRAIAVLSSLGLLCGFVLLKQRQAVEAAPAAPEIQASHAVMSGSKSVTQLPTPASVQMPPRAFMPGSKSGMLLPIRDPFETILKPRSESPIASPDFNAAAPPLVLMPGGVANTPSAALQGQQPSFAPAKP